jgi:mRNA interferase MazF
VVSNDRFNGKSNDFVAVPLTSVIKDEPYSVLINQGDLCGGKLLKPSRVRADKIFTVEKNLIVMKIGTVDDKTFQRIKLEIGKIL